jgi:hypothetical protein
MYSTLCIYSRSPQAMFSARGVVLNVTTASVQLRVLHNSVYLSARLKLRGTNLDHYSIKTFNCLRGSSNYIYHVV